MSQIRKTVLPVLFAAIWISISEFARNEFLLKKYWTRHYDSLGLVFPDGAMNGMFWGLWSLLLALFIWIISKKYDLIKTTFLAWLVGFVLMWIVIWNLGVLPAGILIFAVPLSLLEAFLAALIIRAMLPK
jgi:hypothetical protein